MQNLDEFLDKLITEKGVSLSPEEKTKLEEQLTDTVNQAILSHLTDEQLQELSNLVKDPSFDSAQMDDFIEKTGINTDEIAEEAMNDFHNEYLGGENE